MWHSLYKKLISLYPPSFLERFGESMEQTFDDLYREWKEKGSGGTLFLTFLLVETATAIVREHLSSITFRGVMKSFTNPLSAAVIGFILALPVGLLAVIFWLDIQFLQTPLQYAFTTDGQQINMAGRVVMLGGMLLLPVALTLNLMPVIQTARAERRFLAHPSNLLLALLIFSLTILTWGSLIMASISCAVTGALCD